MSIAKKKESEHCCCAESISRVISVCRECGNEGKPIKVITLKSLVKKPGLESVKNPDDFYFCETPDCEVVYFDNEQGIYLDKADVNVRVGVKETDDPVPVCYCFGWTRKKILDQIEQKGFSIAVQEISTRVKAGECTCEINNPAGRCCLGEVSRLVKSVSGEAKEVAR